MSHCRHHSGVDIVQIGCNTINSTLFHLLFGKLPTTLYSPVRPSEKNFHPPTGTTNASPLHVLLPPGNDAGSSEGRYPFIAGSEEYTWSLGMVRWTPSKTA